ncbi:SH3 domain-containing protein [Allocoleopsis franciscana]|uniref:SH3 domain-containing protein n=1 Tax=Allocoleopsis franciscana TaxID=2886352 RepID=UPI0003083841
MAVRNGVYVRQSPSINSAVVGVVPNNRNVTIENKGANGWVPISDPLQGYVSAAYLEYDT